MSEIEAFLKLIEYQQKEIKAKQTAIDYLTKELEELRDEIWNIQIKKATEE